MNTPSKFNRCTHSSTPLDYRCQKHLHSPVNFGNPLLSVAKSSGLIRAQAMQQLLNEKAPETPSEYYNRVFNVASKVNGINSYTYDTTNPDGSAFLLQQELQEIYWLKNNYMKFYNDKAEQSPSGTYEGYDDASEYALSQMNLTQADYSTLTAAYNNNNMPRGFIAPANFDGTYTYERLYEPDLNPKPKSDAESSSVVTPAVNEESESVITPAEDAASESVVIPAADEASATVVRPAEDEESESIINPNVPYWHPSYPAYQTIGPDGIIRPYSDVDTAQSPARVAPAPNRRKGGLPSYQTIGPDGILRPYSDVDTAQNPARFAPAPNRRKRGTPATAPPANQDYDDDVVVVKELPSPGMMTTTTTPVNLNPDPVESPAAPQWYAGLPKWFQLLGD